MTDHASPVPLPPRAVHPTAINARYAVAIDITQDAIYRYHQAEYLLWTYRLMPPSMQEGRVALMAEEAERVMKVALQSLKVASKTTTWGSMRMGAGRCLK